MWLKSSRTKWVWASKMNCPARLCARACVSSGVVRLGRVDLEHAAPKTSFMARKAAAMPQPVCQELPAAQAELLAVLVGQLDDPPLDALLRVALRRRKILAVGHDLGRYRRCRGGFFSSCNKAHFSVAKPTAHRGFLPKDGC